MVNSFDTCQCGKWKSEIAITCRNCRNIKIKKIPPKRLPKKESLINTIQRLERIINYHEKISEEANRRQKILYQKLKGMQ